MILAKNKIIFFFSICLMPLLMATMEHVQFIERKEWDQNITYIGRNRENKIVVAAALISGGPTDIDIYEHFGDKTKLGYDSISIYNTLESLYLNQHRTNN